MRTFAFAWIAFGISIAGTGAAANSPAECAQMGSDSARLVCYDVLFRHTAATPEEVFGAEQIPHVETPKVEPEQPRNLESSITAIDQRPRGELTFTLVNGQKWTQKEVEKKKRYTVGDRVTVERVSLGGYVLTNTRGVSSRVKRLE